MSFFSDIGGGAQALSSKLGQSAGGFLQFANETLVPLAGQVDQWRQVVNNFKGGKRPPPATIGNTIAPGQLPVAAEMPAKPAPAAERTASTFSPMVLIGLAAVALLVLSKGK
jgi:hypothetical protein